MQVGASDIQLIKRYGDIPRVECYPGQLNQVFMNLLYNAIEAIERKKTRLNPQLNHGQPEAPDTICVTTELTQSNWVEIRIADSGSGISDEIKPYIFDPFFTTKSVGEGTGLGLSISYQIVTEKHKGRLEFNSLPEQGSEFVISIPISGMVRF